MSHGPARHMEPQGNVVMEEIDILVVDGRILTFDEHDRVIPGGAVAIRSVQFLALGETPFL